MKSKARRVYWQLGEFGGFVSLAILPRIRLAYGSSIGLGFGWLNAWLHVWLRNRESPNTHMMELLPHLWFHWHREHGYGVHLWWLQWKGHWWINRRSKNAEDATL